MTTYTAITNAEIDQDSPVTQPLMTALRDNPIAIAEADSSVALSLLPTVKLGTLTTSSGASVSLTSLDLAPYRFVKIIHNDVTRSVSSNLLINGKEVTHGVGSGVGIKGFVICDLQHGIGFGIGGEVATDLPTRIVDNMITSATTTITATLSSGTFTGGTIEVYGVK